MVIQFLLQFSFEQIDFLTLLRSGGVSRSDKACGLFAAYTGARCSSLRT